MQILYYFMNHDSMMFQWQKMHIVDEMSKHGCNIDIISPLEYENIDQANEEILHILHRHKHDLFMTCFAEEHLHKDTLQSIHNMGIPTLLFCPDNLVDPFRHKSIANLFDLVWLTSKETKYLFDKWGCKSVFLPYAANPDFLIPRKCTEEIKRVGFIGTPHGSRIDRINALLNGRIPVTMHSTPQATEQTLLQASISDYLHVLYQFSRYPIGRKLAKAAIIDKLAKRSITDPYGYLERSEPVKLENLSMMNGSYAMVLAFSDANSTGILARPVPIVNLRNFEIPMSGGVEFTIYTDELSEYFENGKEIIMGRTNDECVELARYYLQDNQAETRKMIRMKARRRAESEHTWYQRFSKAFDILGLKK